MPDGARLHVRILGRGQPIVLLHGFAMESRHWLPFAYPLATKYRVIMPDLRGFGRSHELPFDKACVLSTYAIDLESLFDQLQLTDIRLAGISMGALTALQYFRLYGQDRCLRYLHIDQSPRGLNNEEWAWGLFGQDHVARMQAAQRLITRLQPYVDRRAPYEALPNELRSQLWEELGRFFASAMSRPTHKRLLARLARYEAFSKRMLPTTNWPAYICCLRAYLDQDYDMRDVLQALDLPVSLLIGMKSEMYPRAGQLRMADLLKNVDVLPFTNSGHAPLVDEPIKFMRTLFRWAH